MLPPSTGAADVVAALNERRVSECGNLSTMSSLTRCGG